MILSYDRIEACSATGKCVMTSEWAMPVHKLPAMPENVTKVDGADRWYRKTVGRAATVLETWRIEAA